MADDPLNLIARETFALTNREAWHDMGQLLREHGYASGKEFTAALKSAWGHRRALKAAARATKLQQQREPNRE